ncbi:MAG: T9SS type A sorting domain-containing protein [Bacteroidales bacterium]|nr:T9SS type A sorting domain-containing protein [Bacteroidales bacterium]
MKKNTRLSNFKNQLLLLLILYIPIAALSQTDCDLYINPSFESDCILTEYDKEDTTLMEFDPGCMAACKGMTVQYDAVCSNGSQFVWTISGASSYQLSNQNRTAHVTWGSNSLGNIMVQANIADSIICTAETCVQLLEPSHVESQTIPDFYYDPIGGTKWIDICLGTEIQLMDMSTTDETPIVGCCWETPYGNAYTPNYSIIPTQSGEFLIKHKIVNECGCEDMEQIKVRVLEPVDLQLSCYGTVCGGTSATYTILSPSCTEYRWSVKGGTISDGQNTPTIMVQWGNPVSGYGVISIDAAPCESECNALISVKIPVITNHATIEGPDVVCVGEVQIYELPAWGSTNYLWQVTPLDSNVTTYEAERINQIMLEFSQPGVYNLSVQYECEFLDCGPYSSTKTIIVKDTLRIHTADNTVCEGLTGKYMTNCSNNVNWRVYNQNGQLVHSSYTDTLYYTFAVSGRYKVEASHVNFCNVATYFVTVKANPPAIESVTGPSEACLSSSILLSGTPTQPNCFLEWVPVCATATPQIWNADSVTITYNGEVCDVNVYQVDNEYGCHSSAYTHEVNVFALAPSGLPSDTTVCAGNTFSLSVPQQENVLYEWTITPSNVATVMTNHLTHAVSILANHLYSAPPHTAVITLKRTCCSGTEVVETLVLHVADVPTPTINYNNPVCEGDVASFYVTSPISNPSHYIWQIEGNTHVGDSVSHVFSQPGVHSFTMSYKPYANCPAVLVGGKVRVVASPLVLLYDDGQHIAVTMYPNANYYWELDGNPVQPVQGEEYLCPHLGNGTYCCTISFNNAPYCSAIGCMTLGDTPEDTCLVLSLDTAYQSCTEVSLSLDNPYGGSVDWAIYPYYAGNYFSQQSDSSAAAVFTHPGIYRVFAYMEIGSQCYKGLQLVDIESIPDFDLTYSCNNPVLFQDFSLNRTINSVVSKNLYIQETNLTVPITGTQQQIPNGYFATGYNHIVYTINLSNGQQCQLAKILYIDTLPVIDSMFVSQNMCEQTPFMFSAITSNGIIRWDFGEGSYLYGNNVYHTYSTDYQYPNVILTVTNADGCVASINKVVTVHTNMLESGNLLTEGAPICPGYARHIYYTYNNIFNMYFWEHSSFPSSNNTYDTYQTGDYTVLVVNSFNGCKKERTKNVRFLNAPTARITGQTKYCYNEMVKLYGNTGLTNSYLWIITGPESYTDTLPNISFIPTQAGTYSANLTVTSPDGCSATANYNFIVHPPVAAPIISFYGNQCIHTPPVGVHSIANQNLFWSNGYNGTTAYYYTPGFLTAYYIDPITGCPSEKASMFIDPAPNYDALLTGCYEKCEKDLPLTLPVYKLYPYQPSNLYWHWLYNGNLLLSGNTLNFNLPINDFGTYFMKATYGNGCSSNSPLLTISKDDICDCDSIAISVKKTCFVEDCKLFYTLLVTIHNNSSQTVTFDQMHANQNTAIIGVTSLPVSIAPYSSQTIVVKVEFADFQNGYVDFSLINTMENCEKSFSEFFKWQDCVNENCEIENSGITFLEDMSTPHQTSCFKLSMTLPSNTMSLVALWSDPPQIINNYYYAPSIAVCMLMLNYGQLTQMVANGESICFYAILCVENKLCYAKVCTDAMWFYELIPEEYRNWTDTNMIDTTKSMHLIPKKEDQQPNDTPYLSPNPTQDEVTVMGIASDSVSEIMVLTMEGRQVAVFRNDYRFNISHLSRASYIVRIITTDKQVHYLKLVKQ